MTPAAKKKFGWILAGIFTFALLMGPGPGMLLINSPEPIFGLPALYVWGVLWFLVESGVVVLAFLYVWDDSDPSDDSTS